MSIKLSSMAELISGQITRRIEAGGVRNGEVIDTKILLTPKAITSNGAINAEALEKIQLVALPDDRRLTKSGDIVIKLSAPYDAVVITEEYEGLLVPSFCAIIRVDTEVKSNFLAAFINSRPCKNQFKKLMAGQTVSMITIGKIGDVDVPELSVSSMKTIGNEYLEACDRIKIANEIISLEKKRNDIRFRELMNND